MNILYKKVLFIIFVFVFFSLINISLPIIFSLTCSGTPISSCRYAITKPGVYYITRNLSVYSWVCIVIGTNNVVINGCGNSITNTGNGYGIYYTSYFFSPSFTISNLTIENINFYNFNAVEEGDYAIYLDVLAMGRVTTVNFHNINLINISLYNSPQGISFYGISSGEYEGFVSFSDISFNNIYLYNSPQGIFWHVASGGVYCDTNLSYNSFNNVYLYNSPQGIYIYGSQCTLGFQYNNFSNIYLYNSPEGLYLNLSANVVLRNFILKGQVVSYNNFSNIYSYSSSNSTYIYAYIHGSPAGYETFTNNIFSFIYGQNTSNLLYIYAYGNTNLTFGNNLFNCIIPDNQITIENPPLTINPTLQSKGSHHWSDSYGNIYECSSTYQFPLHISSKSFSLITSLSPLIIFLPAIILLVVLAFIVIYVI